MRRISAAPGRKASSEPALARVARRIASASCGSIGRASRPRYLVSTGNERPSAAITGAASRSLATRAPSIVADMTRSRKSSRRPFCTSRAKASPRSASSERSWNSSNRTAATFSSIGSSRISRVKMPSVTISIWVRREVFEPKRTRRPTVSPTFSPKVLAIRVAAARAAILRGSNTRMRRSAAQGSPPSANGTRVVLPAPGGATKTATLRPRNTAVSSGSAVSIGNGGE